ncbi:UNVERIFIED_ORG: hypothetical protein BDK47_11680 [Anoxybacillus amylolyticus]
MYRCIATKKQCLEGRKVYALFCGDEFVRYVGKRTKKEKERLQGGNKRLGIPSFVEISLLHGWYYDETKDCYVLFEEGDKKKEMFQCEGMPKGILRKRKR